MARRRYVGVGYESSAWGTEAAPQYFIDPASCGVDIPDSPEIIQPGGLNRHKRNHQPGMYIPGGPTETVFDISTAYHIIAHAFGGACDFTDATTEIAEPSPEELFTTGVGETTGSDTMGKVPVIPGTLTIQTAAPADVASDNGFGTLTAENASGVTGTINYATGALSLIGLTAETAYEAVYFEGETDDIYTHVVTPGTDDTLHGLSLDVGKDQHQHAFTGCSISQFTITVEKEYAMLNFDVIGEVDKTETIVAESVVLAKLPRWRPYGDGYPVPFHRVTAKMVDYGGSLAAFQTSLESLSLTYSNGADGESGVTLGSRNPQRIWGGEIEITGEMALVFDGTDELQDFWGGASAPADAGTTEKALEITFSSDDTSPIGSIVLSLPKCIFQNVGITASGRERIIQAVKFEALYDDTATHAIQMTANSIQNWDTCT